MRQYGLKFDDENNFWVACFSKNEETVKFVF